MARAFGEAVVQDIHGNVMAGVAVDLIDPATNVRILDTVFADATSATTLALPLTTNQYGRAPFYLAVGKLVIGRSTINGVPYDDLITVVDPTASGTGGVPTHTHIEPDVTNLPADLAARAFAAHTHAESDVTNLPTDLGGKAAASHTHTEANVTNLPTDLANKAAVVHTHVESDVTNLVADLASKISGTHTHNVPVTAAGYQWINPTGADVEVVGWGIGTTTITRVEAIRVGGTAATINFRLRGTDLVIADLSAGTTVASTTTIVNATINDGDQVEAMLQSITGTPSSVLVRLYGTRVTV